MRVLVACECSGMVRDAFRFRGHDAWSCDLQPSEGVGEFYHLLGDCLSHLDGPWDLLIAHPPCTFLCNSGAVWLHQKNKQKALDRLMQMDRAAKFFLKLWNAPILRIAIENPIMHGYAKKSIGVRQSQLIQPWMFGHPESKATCLWLKNLPLLKPTKIEPFHYQWSQSRPPSSHRSKDRSETLPGIASAMADQWGSME